MNIYMGSSELDLEADLMVDDLNDVSTKENDFSKKDLRVLHSLMDAFDVDFKTAVSEFWWNLNGERKEDNSGFWFQTQRLRSLLSKKAAARDPKKILLPPLRHHAVFALDSTATAVRYNSNHYSAGYGPMSYLK